MAKRVPKYKLQPIHAAIPESCPKCGGRLYREPISTRLVGVRCERKAARFVAEIGGPVVSDCDYEAAFNNKTGEFAF